MAQLVDSSVFIAFERRKLSLTQLPDVAQDTEAALSSITASELLVGVFRSDSRGRRVPREAFVEGVLDSFPVIPFDVETARTHAALSAPLSTAGTRIDAHDLIIAATALTFGYGGLTENLRDFERVPGLIVRRLAWPK